jgi:colanic acid/amylovoran biosynthesis glycosyltransferase
MGIDTARFSATPGKELGQGGLKMLSIARLVEKKGIQYGIEALARVLERAPDRQVKYWIAGDGPLKMQLLAYAASLGVEDRVRFLGWMDQEEISDLMRRADILVAPSVTGPDGDQEGIPVVLMEALAMGLPVVSTLHSGIPELIVDGETGLLARERDAEGLAERILALISDRDLVRRLQNNGRKHVKEQFDICKLNKDLEHMCLDLICK